MHDSEYLGKDIPTFMHELKTRMHRALCFRLGLAGLPSELRSTQWTIDERICV